MQSLFDSLKMKTHDTNSGVWLDCSKTFIFHRVLEENLSVVGNRSDSPRGQRVMTQSTECYLSKCEHSSKSKPDCRTGQTSNSEIHQLSVCECQEVTEVVSQLEF